MSNKPTRADQVRQRRMNRSAADTPAVPAVRPTVHPAERPSRRQETPRTRSSRFGGTTPSGVLDRYLPTGGNGRPAPRPSQARYGRNPDRSDYSFNIGRAAVHAPALSVPQLGPRWISLGLSVLLIFLLYTLWTSSLFTVETAEVKGNDRLTLADINSVTGLVGQPIFKAVPAQVLQNLRSTFPDLASVRVSVGFPNRLTITVVERTPVLAWYQGDSVTWIDGNGIAFMPRGAVKGLIQVAASGTPPKQAVADGTPLFDQAFIDPAMVKAMVTLSPYVPKGAPMVYDPQYGMGWQDSHGWSVYFGSNTDNIPMKLAVYQSIVATFEKDGIQPSSMVSLEYLDAPFYK